MNRQETLRRLGYGAAWVESGVLDDALLERHPNVGVLDDCSSGTRTSPRSSKKPARCAADACLYHLRMSLPPLYKPRQKAPWGDYGSILVHGMTTHAPRRADGLVPLERTGPFVPPITMPWQLVVTAGTRAILERSGLTGLSFGAVHKTRIVRSDWEQWDPGVDEPDELLEFAEPEDCVLALPHDEALARSMPELHAIVPTGRARIEKRPPPPPDPSIPEWVMVTLPGRSEPFRVKNPVLWSAHLPVLVIVEHDGSDLALAPPYEIPILSERARGALASPWLDFEPFTREG